MDGSMPVLHMLAHLSISQNQTSLGQNYYKSHEIMLMPITWYIKLETAFSRSDPGPIG